MSADQEIKLPRMPEPVAFVMVRPTDKHETGVITQAMAAELVRQGVILDRASREKKGPKESDQIISVAASLMRQYGGGFAHCIGNALMCADHHNKALIVECFADLMAPYIERAKAMK